VLVNEEKIIRIRKSRRRKIGANIVGTKEESRCCFEVRSVLGIM